MSVSARLGMLVVSSGLLLANLVFVAGCPGAAGDSLQASAAADTLTIEPGQSVTLDVTVTGGAGGYTYAWTPADGLSDPTAPAPVASPAATTTYTLTVTDAAGAQATLEVQVVVGGDAARIPAVPGAPLAHAGPDLNLRDENRDGRETVTLDASASVDDGQIVSYVWLLAGTQLATGATVTLELEVGTHTIVLVVTDDSGLSARDEVVVAIDSLDNRSPTAVAGDDLSLVDDDGDGFGVAVVDGSASFDPDGQIVAYRWIAHGQVLAETVSVELGFGIGENSVTLEVEDDDGATATDVLHVTVAPTDATHNQSPTAVPVVDPPIAVDDDRDGVEVVTLDARQSTDPDGRIVAARWLKSGTTFSRDMVTTVELPVGEHPLRLEVTDDLGRRDQTEFIVKIAPPITIAAGADQVVSAERIEGQTRGVAALSAQITGGAPDYHVTWQAAGQPEVYEGREVTARLPLGVHAVTLTVTDSRGVSVTDTVTVTVVLPASGGSPDTGQSCELNGGACSALDPVLDLAITPVGPSGDVIRTEFEIVTRRSRTMVQGGPLTYLVRAGNPGQHVRLRLESGFSQASWTQGELAISQQPTAEVPFAAGVHFVTARVREPHPSGGELELEATVRVIVNPPAHALLADGGDSRFFDPDSLPRRIRGSVIGGVGPYILSWSPAELVDAPTRTNPLLLELESNREPTVLTFTVRDAEGRESSGRVWYAPQQD